MTIYATPDRADTGPRDFPTTDVVEMPLPPSYVGTDTAGLRGTSEGEYSVSDATVTTEMYPSSVTTGAITKDIPAAEQADGEGDADELGQKTLEFPADGTHWPQALADATNPAAPQTAVDRLPDVGNLKFSTTVDGPSDAASEAAAAVFGYKSPVIRMDEEEPQQNSPRVHQTTTEPRGSSRGSSDGLENGPEFVSVEELYDRFMALQQELKAHPDRVTPGDKEKLDKLIHSIADMGARREMIEEPPLQSDRQSIAARNKARQDKVNKLYEIAESQTTRERLRKLAGNRFVQAAVGTLAVGAVLFGIAKGFDNTNEHSSVDAEIALQSEPAPKLTAKESLWSNVVPALQSSSNGVNTTNADNAEVAPQDDLIVDEEQAGRYGSTAERAVGAPTEEDTVTRFTASTASGGERANSDDNEGKGPITSLAAADRRPHETTDEAEQRIASMIFNRVYEDRVKAKQLADAEPKLMWLDEGNDNPQNNILVEGADGAMRFLSDREIAAILGIDLEPLESPALI